MDLGGDAKVLLQNLLSRKRVLAQSGSLDMPAVHPSQVLHSPAASANWVTPGTQQVLQQEGAPVTAPHQESMDAAAAHSSNSRAADSAAVASNAELKMQQLSAAAAAATDAANFGRAGHHWGYAAAEEELERELKQLGVLGGQQQQQHQRPVPADTRRRSSAGGVAAPADPYAASESSSVLLEGPNGLTDAAHVAGTASPAGAAASASACSDVADMLSAALDEALLGDPNTSIDDIVGILSIALNMPSGEHASGNSAGATQEHGVSQARPQQHVQAAPAWQHQTGSPEAARASVSSHESFLAAREKVSGLPPGMTHSTAASGSRGSTVNSSREQGIRGDDGNSRAATETASEMAARLLEQARAMHARAAAHAGAGQPAAAAAAAAQAAPSAGGAAQQAASASMRAWQAEGGLMYKHSSGGDGFRAPTEGLGYHAGGPSSASYTHGAGVGAATAYPGSLQQQSRMSPLSTRSRGSGSYAGRASARCSMSQHAAAQQYDDGEGESQGQPHIAPAEVDRAWRQGLRSPEREGVAQGSAGGKGGGEVLAILEGFDGSAGPQEWSAYDGLLGLRQQRQTGSGAGVAGSGSGSGPSDPLDVNSYRARRTPELDAKLQRLYQRNVDWRQRCEVVYAQQRFAEVASELQACTFRPQINKKSERLVQQNNMCYPQRPGRPLAAAAANQRPASTGRMGLKRRPDKQQQQWEEQQEQHGAVLRAAAAAAAVLGEEAGLQLMDHMLRSSRRSAAAAGPITAGSAASNKAQQALNKHAATSDDEGFAFDSRCKTDPGDSSSGAKRSGSSPQRQASPAKVPAAVLRLYEDAAEKQARQAQLQEAAVASERQARSRSAPRSGAYRDVAPRVYNHMQDGPASPPTTHRHHLQSGLSECTFHPRTNCSRSSRPASPQRTKAAAAAAGSGNGGGLLAADGEFALAVLEQMQSHQQQLDEDSPDFYVLLQDRQQQQQQQQGGPVWIAAAGTAAEAAGESEGKQQQQGDWAEFIERQGLFLLLKEAKRAQIAAQLARKQQPKLSPGSKRILKEKQRMAEQVRGCSLDSAAAAAAAALQQLHQQYHVTAHVHPGCLHYQPNGSASTAAEDTGEMLRSAAAAGSPGGGSVGSPASAGSAFLSRVQHQVKQRQQQHNSCSPPHNSCGSPSSCTSGSPGNSGSFGQLHGAARGRGGCSADIGGSSMARGAAAAVSAARGAEFSFRPAITRKAAAMKPRSVDDMSEGDRLRREAKLEQLRIVMEARSLAGATFAPDMSPSRRRPGSAGAAPGCGYEAVQPRIRLSPDGLAAYLGSLQQKRRDLEERRRRQEQQREDAELAKCTFKPATTPPPAYLAAAAGLGYTGRFIEARLAGALRGPGGMPGGHPGMCQHSKLD